MPAVAKAKTIGPEFSNQVTLERVTYDFAVDGGAVSTFDLFTAGADVVLKSFHAYVKTAATSGGSATVALGVTGSATAFVDTTAGAVANLTANAVLGSAIAPRRLPSGSKVIMTVGTAALTAGKIEVVVEYCKA
jgi:hypothetical protein